MSMMEKAMYLKGLCDGLEPDLTTKEGKLIAALLDMVNEMAAEMDDMQAEICELKDYCEELDEDLGDVEEVLLDLDDEDEDYWGNKSWYWHLFSGKSDRWECYISTIIGYMMYRENKEIRNDLVMDALEDVYAGSYVFITDEGEKTLQERRDQREEDIREGRIILPDPAQRELPFTD